ncbi:NAD(P)/FAD-dependent oxidoreductase [Cellulomonas sp. FA1]|jgi:sulfide:quinone oxidoreductase|uniref:NAD(P)/FAD-dependent oxidoreductase n=1 Tax=Cellulomonas sp. FA1 TaxID=1346710 RepID=UPI0006267FC6|nr:FAD/NAD(P)-binding oxidoreductase [Cellulomonas sp. FA1]
MSPARRHDVVVVGGGNAGISLAAKLLRDGCRDVAVVEPKAVHHYRPLLSYVAGGAATLDDLTRPQERAMPRGVHRYADRATAVDVDAAEVVLAGGTRLAYRDVAVCPGSEVDHDAMPGLREAFATPHAATSYLVDHAPRTWRMLSGLTSGRAVFVVSDRHVPCAPVGLKPLFLAADHWRRTGVLDDVEIDLLLEGPRLAGLARADHELRAAARRYGVRVRTGTTVTRVDGQGRTLEVASPDGPRTLGYDALYVAPPHRAPAWVAASGLAGAGSDGFVDVDPETLRHRVHPRVWALGDVATVGTSPSGGALRKQVPVVSHNIAAQRAGAPVRRYDGYTVAPVTTSRTRLLLAEHDRDGRAEPTVPFPDLTRPRRALYLFDRHVEPLVYWHRLLRGKVS